jgi:hypothetical protein
MLIVRFYWFFFGQTEKGARVKVEEFEFYQFNPKSCGEGEK